jgi:hypothetical protein
MPALRALTLVALATSMLTGCITRFSNEPFLDTKTLRIYLRSEKTLTGVVERDREQPAIIAPVRMTYILARIDVRNQGDSGKVQEGAIPADMLYEIGEGLSGALAKANPNQDVVVMAFRKERRLGVFDEDYMTSLLAYVRDGSLFIHLSQLNWPIPKRRDLELPEPRIGDHSARFRVQPDVAMTVVDAQSLAVDWKDPIFAHETRTKLLPTGEVLRKTILLESPPEPEVETVPEIPDSITSEQLRALADLEDERRSGAITEPQYRARKREILEGQ